MTFCTKGSYKVWRVDKEVKSVSERVFSFNEVVDFKFNNDSFSTKEFYNKNKECKKFYKVFKMSPCEDLGYKNGTLYLKNDIFYKGKNKMDKIVRDVIEHETCKKNVLSKIKEDEEITLLKKENNELKQKLKQKNVPTDVKKSVEYIKLKNAYKLQQTHLKERDEKIFKLEENYRKTRINRKMLKVETKNVGKVSFVKVEVPCEIKYDQPSQQKNVDFVGNLNEHVKLTDRINNVKVKKFIVEVKSRRTTGAREHYLSSGVIDRLSYLSTVLHYGTLKCSKILQSEGFKAFKGGNITRDVIRNIFRWFE